MLFLLQGKTSLQSSLQLDSYDWISPEELFEDNPSYGLRDVALAAIEKLKKVFPRNHLFCNKRPKLFMIP